MAVENRANRDDLEFWGEASTDPHKFGFFAAIRKIECLFSDKPRLGESSHARDDAVRLAQDPHLIFPPSTLSSISVSDGKLPRVASYFLGLFGPQGPLPLHLTDFAHDRIHNHDDDTFSAFADVFHHRAISLFYRAWAMSQPTVSLDRPESDKFGAKVAAFSGLGLPSLRERDAMPDMAKLYFTGLLGGRGKHPAGLQSILSVFFSTPVRIREFVGDWMVIPEAIRTRLGINRNNALLGKTASLGARAWGCHQKFGVELGPMGISEFRRFLPGGESLDRLSAIVKNYIGKELSWDVRLILTKEEVPPLKLGGGERLGWSTWLKTDNREKDADDLCLGHAQ